MPISHPLLFSIKIYIDIMLFTIGVSLEVSSGGIKAEHSNFIRQKEKNVCICTAQSHSQNIASAIPHTSKGNSQRKFPYCTV